MPLTDTGDAIFFMTASGATSFRKSLLISVMTHPVSRQRLCTCACQSLLNCTVAVVYFHPPNLYPVALEFLGTLNSMMTLGVVSGFAYSTLTVLGDSGFFTFAGFGARHTSQRCL